MSRVEANKRSLRMSSERRERVSSLAHRLHVGRVLLAAVLSTAGCTSRPELVGLDRCEVTDVVATFVPEPGPPPPTKGPQASAGEAYETFDLKTAIEFHNDATACLESIHANPLEGGYVITERLRIDSPFDADTDGDGYTLVIDTAAADITIDARTFPPDSCAVEINASLVRLGPMKLIVPPLVWPICDFGNDNDYGEVHIEDVPSN